MSVISNAFNAFHTLLAITFPNHFELIDPYRPEANDDLTYVGAYGLAIADGLNLEVEMECTYTMERSLILTLTRKVFKGELQRKASAVTERKTKEKQLFEDLHLIVKATEESVTLNSSTANISFCKYVSDSGLEYVNVDDNHIIMIRALFELRYAESLGD